MAKHKYIESPDKLWEYFLAYVETEKNNPLYKREYVGKDGFQVDTPLQVPITFEGFECYLADLGVIDDLGDYSKNDDGRYTEYAPIITRIRKNCFAQNFKGAAVGLFNANIIAKKLGLAEKTENKNDNTHSGKIQIEVVKTDVPLANNEKDIKID